MVLIAYYISRDHVIEGKADCDFFYDNNSLRSLLYI